MEIHHVMHEDFVRNLSQEDLFPFQHDTDRGDSLESDINVNRSNIVVATENPVKAITNADQDDDCSTSTSVKSSVLSEADWRYENGDDFDEDRSKPESLQKNFDHLKREFRRRDQLLIRITKGRSKAFARQIQERELLVRRRTLDDLLLLAKVWERLETDALCRPFDGDVAPLLNDRLCTKELQVFPRRFYNYFTFEMSTNFPAACSLLVHSIVHNTLYDGLHSCFNAISAVFAKSSKSSEVNVCLFAILFILGVFLMRFTGDLCWWLSDQDYDLVKFDFHNRWRLHYWDARILSSIRVRRILRVAMYMTGYNFCWMATSAFHFSLERFFDSRDAILEGLPSAKFEEGLGVCLAERKESICAKSCEAEFRRQGTCV